MRNSLEDSEFSLATLPPTLQQRRLALALVGGLAAAFGATAPFADLALPRVDALIPTIEAVFCVNDLITAALLFGQFSISRSTAVLVLATGYLTTALIVIPHALTFPGAFSPTGALGAGPQSTVWLYFFWHLIFPTSLLIYALLKDSSRLKYVSGISTRSAVGCSVAFALLLVLGLTWLAIAGDALMPRLMQTTTAVGPLANDVAAFTLVICAMALGLLVTRLRSMLDLWLIVVLCAAITEMILSVVLISARFSLGWYAGRFFSLATSIIVLVVLLAETTRLYARLARSHQALQHERAHKLMTLEAMTASLSHEVRQPLAAIAMNSRAAMRYLRRIPPDLDEAQSNLSAIDSDSHRASDVFDNIRALFGRRNQQQEAVDLNELVLEALLSLRGELEERGVVVHAELASDLPPVSADRGQLQQVLLNLIQNAVEAMDGVQLGCREAWVTTRHNSQDELSVMIKDSGRGVDPDKINSIFDAFVTTKPRGMGLGLAICRMIVERHGGRLSVRSREGEGAVFQFSLPISSAISRTRDS